MKTKTTATPGAFTPPASVTARVAGHTECECGCGSLCARRFLPGHDARLKSALIGLAVAGDAQARTRISGLGWTAHLAIREAALARRAEEKSARVPRAPVPPKPRPSRAVVPPTESRSGSDGRVPASVTRLSGRIGRKVRIADVAQVHDAIAEAVSS